MFSPSYEHLSRFAGNLATCLEAGLDMAQSLKTTRRALVNTRFGGAMNEALMRVQKGETLSEALSAAERGWPATDSISWTYRRAMAGHP